MTAQPDTRGFPGPDIGASRNDGPQRVWVRCANVGDLAFVEAIEEHLIERSSDVSLVPSLPAADAQREGVEEDPVGADEIRAFMARINPSAILQIGDVPEARLLTQANRAGCPVLLANITAQTLQKVPRRWFPRSRARLFASCARLLTADRDTTDRLNALLGGAQIITEIGLLRKTPSVLPYDRDDHAAIVNAMGTRQSWLASALPRTELDDVINAHRRASRTAHRLLLFISPRNLSEAAAMSAKLHAAGFVVGQRSRDRVPDELMQVFVIDQPAEQGLWYRVAPICYLGGTLQGGGCRDPFEAASLGSALVAGPNSQPYLKQITELRRAGAVGPVKDGKSLGDLVERLLPADRAAAMAHAAWDVTTQGAVVTERVVSALLGELKPRKVE